ncbi:MULTISPECIES: hypothetical protein [Haloarcula]|uniref:Uncharacterized protein n=1 Tax=Haloarcula pellucida TaxID=1427151 RepID=A0A830GK08_9EURY|nr:MULTISPECIES: hypothetical protein [Halomicroarcula]MBX0348891.1 hypothetical protein [Halomicroarcula pellucida]MDS0278655.1 hypothetical protein [Halomicroarcula sp. S1AR25-4]GGN91354.1 hypothetical protein GCM10009030_14190 [Halomicroarcula pellucida]
MTRQLRRTAGVLVAILTLLTGAAAAPATDVTDDRTVTFTEQRQVA